MAMTLSQQPLLREPLPPYLSRPVAEGAYILVGDVLTAFQRLAQYYLEKMQVDVLAVTGSNGKTTTKDMLAQLLATTYKTYKTQGNYNNENRPALYGSAHA